MDFAESSRIPQSGEFRSYVEIWVFIYSSSLNIIVFLADAEANAQKEQEQKASENREDGSEAQSTAEE